MHTSFRSDDDLVDGVPAARHLAETRSPRSRRFQPHAVVRQGQRSLNDRKREYVLAHGTLMARTGVWFVILRRDDVPEADRANDYWMKLVNTVVLLGQDADDTITLYRNRRALRNVKRKPKWRRAKAA